MEGLCFRAPPALLGMPSPTIAAVKVDARAPSLVQASAAGRNANVAGAVVETSAAPPGSRHSYGVARPLMRVWRVKSGGSKSRDLEAIEERDEGGEEKSDGEEQQEEEEDEAAGTERRRGMNWVLKTLRVRSAWSAEERKREGGGGDDGVLQKEDGGADDEDEGDHVLQEGNQCVGCCEAEESGRCHVGEVKGEMELDRVAFMGLLRKVSLKEARLFERLSYLSRIAYTIPRIKPANLLKHRQLRFVTSSVGKRQNVPNAEKLQSAVQDQETHQLKGKRSCEKGESQRKNGHLVSPSSAYRVAASAASYIHSQTRSILPFRSSRSESGLSLTGVECGDEIKGLTSSEVASLVATTNSVTAVVAAREETKQAVAEDLNSAKSSPCEWFVCDDDSSRTRLFVIQGSESLASWQANLLFEPVQFEGLDVIVHRGIYEAAKGIYRRMLPLVRDHLRFHGNSATFRFTGHSLGGSLSLLVSLMLLIRGEVPSSSLLPVVTFGSPYVMCGGDYLLQKLGLPLNYVQAIMMHRDIVPRAFSCNYPDHVAEILKTVNGKFRRHPCLRHQRLLYAPMGQLLIVQPEEKYSPHHNLLPSGTGFYVLDHESLHSKDSTGTLRLARSTFLNTPHPLEILSDRAAYGSEGAIYRDHDVNAYLRSLRGVVRGELERIRKARRKRRRQMRWLLVGAPLEINESIVVGRQGKPENSSSPHLGFSTVLQGGMRSLTRLTRFVASRHVHMLVLLLPAKILLLDWNHS